MVNKVDKILEILDRSIGVNWGDWYLEEHEDLKVVRQFIIQVQKAIEAIEERKEYWNKTAWRSRKALIAEDDFLLKAIGEKAT